MIRRHILKTLLAIFVIFATVNQTVFAHSRGMGTLDIRGRNSRVLLTWVFYYDELPPELILPDGSEEKVSLSDPQNLNEGLIKVAKTAFLLKAGNNKLDAPKVSQIIVLPDKTCLIILSYSLEGNGPVEIEAPVLRLLPPNYLINVRFVGADGKVASSLIDKSSPPLIALAGGGAGGNAPGGGGGNPFRAAFTMELGTPWVHTNWILLGILLMVSNPIRRACSILLLVIALRGILVHLALVFGFAFPWRIPAFLLCLPVLAMAALAARSAPRLPSLAAAAVGSSLIYTAYDLEFLPAGERGSSLAILSGYQSGFLAGFLLALAVVFVIGLELNKSLQVRGAWWRGRICWAAAAISLWISIYGLLAK